MAVKIRLRRTGKRNAPCHRIVVADGRSPRDGRFIENLGFYDPRAKNEQIDLERAEYWIGNGAQPSETVSAIIKRAKAGVPLQSTQGEKDAKKIVAETAKAEAEVAKTDSEVEKTAEVEKAEEKTETADAEKPAE